MALIKSKTFDSNITGEYWKIISVLNLNYNTKEVTVRVVLYVDKINRDADKKNIPGVSEIHNITYTEDEPNRTIFYTALKAQIDWFSDATDD